MGGAKPTVASQLAYGPNMDNRLRDAGALIWLTEQESQLGLFLENRGEAGRDGWPREVGMVGSAVAAGKLLSVLAIRKDAH